MQVKVLGFDNLKGAYNSCPDFHSFYTKLSTRNHNQHIDFVIHDCYLFWGSTFCIPKTSFQDFLVWEMHVGSNLGKDRTIALVAIASIGPLSKEMSIVLCHQVAPVS